MRETFTEIVTPLEYDLRKHCLKLATGSSWEADDLFQETLMKAHQSFLQNPDRPMNQSYLLRIATNIRIDQYRSEKMTIVLYLDAGDNKATQDLNLTTYEALEFLAEQLTAKQMVLVVLIDVFSFTAKDAAQLINSTEGAVKEALKRARNRLKKLGKSSEKPVQARHNHTQKVTPRLFDEFLNGFQVGNPYSICRSYLALVEKGIEMLDINRSENHYSFTFRDPDGHLLQFSSKIFF